MKTNAIVRIILFSLAILVLLGILIAGLAFRHYSFNFRAIPHRKKCQIPPSVI